MTSVVRVQVFDQNFKKLLEFGKLGNRDGEFSRPQSMVIDHGCRPAPVMLMGTLANDPAAGDSSFQLTVKHANHAGRLYAKAGNLPRVLGGLGVAIISTSGGLLTDRQAAKRRVGGEVLAYVW